MSDVGSGAWSRALLALVLSACSSNADGHSGDCVDDAACWSAVCASTSAAFEGVDWSSRDVSLEQVALYQAGKIPLLGLPGGADLDGPRVPIIAGKPGLIRAFVRTPEGAGPRLVAAQLTLRNGAKVSQLFNARRLDGASREDDLDSTINFDIEAGLLSVTTRFSLQLIRCDKGTRAAENPRYPATGDEPLGAFELDPLRIVFIPVVIAGRVPATDSKRLDRYSEYLESIYPISMVQYSVGAPLRAITTLGADGRGWQELLQQLSRRHQSDDAPDGVYYYGLAEPAPAFEDYCPGSCVGGIAYVAGAEPEHRHSRVAMGLSYDDRRSSESVGHELAHSHGLKHAPCGAGDDEDERYPYPRGAIGWWGFEYPGTLHDPGSSTDLLGYCSQRWISDYSYRALFESQARIGAPAPPSSNPKGGFRVIVNGPTGMAWADASSESVQAIGSPETAHVLDTNGAVIASVTVYLSRMSDGVGFSAMVPEPKPAWHDIVLRGGHSLPFKSEALRGSGQR